jgi:putative FmdB family regulatory protein
MPTYDYACEGCGGFEHVRPISERDAPLSCPGCGGLAARVLGGAPRLALMNGTTRGVIRAEERASAGSYARMRHPMSCGCCR